MTEFSPSAKVVMDAFLSTDISVNSYYASGPKVAAVLRAAADQVAPWQPEPTEDSVGPTIDYGYAWALFSKTNDIRQELIAIADELEAQ